MGSNEGFKEYAQKWIDLARRVQPPLSNRKLVDMFMGTLTSPFFNHLIGSSSTGFAELILTGEHVECGIMSGKIQVAASSSTVKKTFNNNKEANVVYGQKGRGRGDRNQHKQGNQHRSDAPRRKFTKINMPLSQEL